MSREWQPGDVALYNGALIGLTDGHEWRWVETGLPCLRQSMVPSEARPVVVIDPEDREAVERLMRLYWGLNDGPVASDNMQAALREYANPTPPKPEEPTRAAATVEDATGDWWVRMSRGASGAVWHRIGRPEACAKYRDINAVRVLSEGVDA